MAYNYIGKDIYKQLEQVINKLDESLSINKERIALLGRPSAVV